MGNAAVQGLGSAAALPTRRSLPLSLLSPSGNRLTLLPTMDRCKQLLLMALCTLSCQAPSQGAPSTSTTTPPPTTEASSPPAEASSEDPVAALETTIYARFGRGVNEPHPDTLLTPLQEAVTKASLEAIELLLTHPQIEPYKYHKYCEKVQGINDDFLSPPLLLACLKVARQQVDFEQGLAVVEALLEAGVDPNGQYELLICAADYLLEEGMEAFQTTSKREGGRYVVGDMYFGKRCVGEMRNYAQKRRLLALLKHYGYKEETTPAEEEGDESEEEEEEEEEED